MFRFKLRTLLIATALAAVFLGLQVHVHNKAKRFVETVRENSPALCDEHESYVSIAPISLSDVFRLQRRCRILYLELELEDNRIHSGYSVHRVKCFGETDRYVDAFWDPPIPTY